MWQICVEPAQSVSAQLNTEGSSPSSDDFYSGGHRYCGSTSQDEARTQVYIDYSTRYPEVVPLRNTDSHSVSMALEFIFTHLSFPKRYCRTNLTGALMTEVYSYLRIKPIRTSPYHPETDGMLERFHSTLKAMMRKVQHQFGNQWDLTLPSVLFAYREIPNVTINWIQSIRATLWTSCQGSTGLALKDLGGSHFYLQGCGQLCYRFTL